MVRRTHQVPAIQAATGILQGKAPISPILWHCIPEFFYDLRMPLEDRWEIYFSPTGRIIHRLDRPMNF
jgi:hypothetical protein